MAADPPNQPRRSEEAPRTAHDLLALLNKGELPPRVGRDEPHWYATVQDDGCVLCGAGGESRRFRMRGAAPADPADRFVVGDGPDWACGSHFA